jgi:hypothetical protein
MKKKSCSFEILRICFLLEDKLQLSVSASVDSQAECGSEPVLFRKQKGGVGGGIVDSGFMVLPLS